LAVTPYTWVSWAEARRRMPDIWHFWLIDREANASMVKVLRRGRVECRGPDGVADGYRVRLHDILPALQEISLTSQTARVRYAKRVSTLHTVGYLQPTLVESESEAIAEFRAPELVWEQFRDGLIRFELPTGMQPTGNARSQQRGAYRGTLEEWMAKKRLATLQLMTPAAIANDFRQYCEDERTELLPLLPQRLRAMEPLIKRIVARRLAAVEAKNKAPTASKRP
jgi:hypothetical protein